MLFCYFELIDIGTRLRMFEIDIEIDVRFVMLFCTSVYTFTKLRIPFEDEYICALQTHLQIVTILDSLKLVFSYKLCFFFF